jgi:membrane protease YdiL (CAAX protease family)
VSGRLAAWLLLVGVQILISYATRAGGGKPPKNAVYQWSLSGGALIQYGIILAVVLAIALPEPRRLLALRRPASWPRSLGVSAGVFVAVYVFGVALDPFLHPGREQGLTPSGWNSHHAAQFVASFLAIAVLAPIVEELTFRGLGVSLLEQWGRWFAIVAVGLLFGLAHGLVEGLPILVVLGSALAWLRLETRSVYPGILLHATFNALTLILSVTTHVQN